MASNTFYQNNQPGELKRCSGEEWEVPRGPKGSRSQKNISKHSSAEGEGPILSGSPMSRSENRVRQSIGEGGRGRWKGKVKKLRRPSGGRFKRGNPFRKQRQYSLVAATGDEGKEVAGGKRLTATE